METPWSGLVNGDDGYGSVGLWEGGAEQDEEQEKKIIGIISQDPPELPSVLKYPL
jgi:hypothetical protein